MSKRMRPSRFRLPSPVEQAAIFKNTVNLPSVSFGIWQSEIHKLNVPVDPPYTISRNFYAIPSHMDFTQDLSAFPLRNVLIIDDEQAIHTLYQTALQPDTGDASSDHRDSAEPADVSVRPIVNFTLHHALSGEEGLRICQNLDARRTPPQLAFVDMRMKDWDGVETIQQLRNFDPRLSFVVVTGFPDHALEEVGRRLGAVPIQVFAKPVPCEQLYQTTFSLVSRWNRLHGDC